MHRLKNLNLGAIRDFVICLLDATASGKHRPLSSCDIQTSEEIIDRCAAGKINLNASQMLITGHPCT